MVIAWGFYDDAWKPSINLDMGFSKVSKYIKQAQWSKEWRHYRKIQIIFHGSIASNQYTYSWEG